MKRTVGERDNGEQSCDELEQKRVKYDDELEAVLQLSADDFECVICCGKMLLSPGSIEPPVQESCNYCWNHQALDLQLRTAGPSRCAQCFFLGSSWSPCPRWCPSQSLLSLLFVQICWWTLSSTSVATTSASSAWSRSSAELTGIGMIPCAQCAGQHLHTGAAEMT